MHAKCARRELNTAVVQNGVVVKPRRAVRPKMAVHPFWRKVSELAAEAVERGETDVVAIPSHRALYVFFGEGEA
jgi:hypothetical protein